MPEYIEKCKGVKAACNFGIASNICFRNAIPLGLKKTSEYMISALKLEIS